MSKTANRKATKMPSREMTVKVDEARIVEVAKTARLRVLRAGQGSRRS